MLSSSAPAGLSFLSKAARHSSGFTKSSEDETNPVASLCESCHQTTPTQPLHPPAPHWSPSLSLQMGEDSQEVRLQLELQASGDSFQFNAATFKRKNQFKVAGSPGSPGRVSSGNSRERERERERDKKHRGKEEKEIIMGKPAMLQGNEGILNLQNILN